MNAMTRMAGAIALATLLAACGGGNGGGHEGGNGSAADNAAVPVAGAPVADAPAADVPVAGTSADAVDPSAIIPGGSASVHTDGIESATAAVTQTADPAWVPTWDDAVLDAYYPNRPLTLQVSGAGSVTNVAHGDAGPLCTTGATCVLKYGKYETVTLVAYAKPGMAFRGWSGGCIGAGMASTCKITNSVAHTVLAVFTPA